MGKHHGVGGTKQMHLRQIAQAAQRAKDPGKSRASIPRQAKVWGRGHVY